MSDVCARVQKIDQQYVAPILKLSQNKREGTAMEKAVILSAVRTPVGKFMGGLSPLSAQELGAKVIAEAVRRADIEAGKWMKRSWATWYRRGWDKIQRGRRR